MRAYLLTHSTIQKPDKLLWMLRDRFEKACSSQGVLGQKIRLRLINALKYLTEHVWQMEIEIGQAVAAVEALQSSMRLLEGFRRRSAALLRRPELGGAAHRRRDADDCNVPYLGVLLKDFIFVIDGNTQLCPLRRQPVLPGRVSRNALQAPRC